MVSFALVAAIQADPSAALLCSDVDGTLAPMSRLAADARADPSALAAFRRVAALVGRVALVTGRPAETVLGMGDVASIPGLLIAGHYGLDRWYAGKLTSPTVDPAVTRARSQLPALPDGAYVEDKGLSFVVHTRPAADPAGSLAWLDRPLRELAATHGLEVVDGSFARELRPVGFDKGDVLRELRQDARVVIYLGDDDGDLPAAAALQGFRAAGVFTWLVCAARPGGSLELRDQADDVVEGVPGLTAWLNQLAAGLAGSGGAGPGGRGGT